MEVKNEEDTGRKVEKIGKQKTKHLQKTEKVYINSQVGSRRKLEDRRSEIGKQKEVQTTLDASIQDRQRRSD